MNSVKQMELATLNFVSHELFNHPGWCFAQHAHFICLKYFVRMAHYVKQM